MKIIKDIMLGVKSYRDQHGNLILCNLHFWPMISNDNVIFVILVSVDLWFISSKRSQHHQIYFTTMTDL